MKDDAMLKYKPDTSEIEPESLRTFINDVIDGKKKVIALSFF